MTKHDVVEKWKISAQEDLLVAEDLFMTKKYAYCLYFCQLCLEKAIKAAIVNLTDDAPPISHDLVKLAETAHLTPSKSQIEQLREITTFNVEARYDIHKERLYKKATAEFTTSYVSRTKELCIWIQTKLT